MMQINFAMYGNIPTVFTYEHIYKHICFYDIQMCACTRALDIHIIHLHVHVKEHVHASVCVDC